MDPILLGKGITDDIAVTLLPKLGNRHGLVAGATGIDVALLVVAADDGVMPQTQECIAHAKAADVPVIVALNKTDLPESNIEKILGELAANEITPAEWGGDVEVVRTGGRYVQPGGPPGL